jgi:hypothetical protein
MFLVGSSGSGKSSAQEDQCQGVKVLRDNTKLRYIDPSWVRGECVWSWLNLFDRSLVFFLCSQQSYGEYISTQISSAILSLLLISLAASGHQSQRRAYTLYRTTSKPCTSTAQTSSRSLQHDRVCRTHGLMCDERVSMCINEPQKFNNSWYVILSHLVYCILVYKYMDVNIVRDLLPWPHLPNTSRSLRAHCSLLVILLAR